MWICSGQQGGGEGLPAPLEGDLGGVEGDYLRSFNMNSGGNNIGDRGCRHIRGGGWPRVKKVSIRINQNISGGCDVREEGCRAMAKQKGRLE